jgi:hypothetical protein
VFQLAANWNLLMAALLLMPLQDAGRWSNHERLCIL